MKKTILLTAFLLVPALAYSRALDTGTRANYVANKIKNAIYRIEGIQGIGIGGCNPKTGEENVFNDFVHCVVIGASTDDAFEFLLELYPQGTKINGVFVAVKKRGIPVIEPRISVGG